MEANFLLRKELLGEKEAAEEQALDQKSLDKFETVKRQEQEKRQRATEGQRRAIVNQIDAQLQDKISDHEELLKRKREAQALAQSEAAEIRKRLADRKKKLSEQNFAGLSEEEKAAMLESFKEHYTGLGFAFEKEKARQQAALAKRADLRKQKLERVKRMKMMYAEEQDAKTESAIASNLQAAITGQFEGRSNDELLRQLRQWAAQREQTHKEAQEKKLQETPVQLDPKLLSALILKLV